MPTISTKRKYTLVAKRSTQNRGGLEDAPPTFHLAPLSFEYLARQKCILSFGGLDFSFGEF